MTGPDPDQLHPMPEWKATTYLTPLAADRENVEIGRFTYYDDRDEHGDFFTKNVLHHYPDFGDKLIIGPFCAIAHGVRFIMNGGTHAMSGFSTYPFNIFGHGWEGGFDPTTWTDEHKGDTKIGADVWIGTDAVVMPGVTVGAGAIIAAFSVVTRNVPPYAVVGGNPARVVKTRFGEQTVQYLLSIAWWDWPVDKITRNLAAIRGADLDALKAAT